MCFPTNTEETKLVRMICPNCEIEIPKGRVYMRGTLLGWLLGGFSHKDLYFQEEAPDNQKSKKPNLALRNGSIAEGYRCPECSLLILPGKLNDDGIPQDTSHLG